MITQRDLVDRLAHRNLGAWSVVERAQDIAISDELRRLQRREHITRFTITIHQDVPRGRGSAHLDIDPFDGSADDLIDQAVSLALAAIGPAWSSAPPAAPAKVNILDDDLVKRELDAVAAGALARVRRPPSITVTASARVVREKVTVIASSGFHTTWLATSLHAEALLSTTTPTEHNLSVALHARRSEDFPLDAAITDAATDLLHISTAGPPTPGPCALWLGPEALLHTQGPHPHPHGLWTIFAHQADAAVERQGLTRYRWRSEIIPGAAQLPEPLSILSDGALDFAALSTPVSDDAVATRRFPIIQRGIATGLGLSPREAALRRTDPNGGVRNLIVSLGTWSPSPSPTARTIEVRRLHSLSLDLHTGHAALDIALGFDHHPNRPPTPFTGGTLHLDLITTLARARRSNQPLHRGAYHGPSSVFIDDAELAP